MRIFLAAVLFTTPFVASLGVRDFIPGILLGQVEEARIDHGAACGEALATADRQLAAGDVALAADGLLATLRGLPGDDPSLIDAAYPLFQSLTFTMAALLSQEDLAVYLEKVLDPAADVDALVLAHFWREVRDYNALRGLTLPSEKDQRDVLWRVAEHGDGYARAGALVLLANPHWKELGQGEIEEIVTALNELAAVCPDAITTREALREIVRVCGGLAFESPEMATMALDLPQWNADVQALVAADPVAQLAYASAAAKKAIPPGNTLSAQQAAVQPLLDAVHEHPDASVRSWCARTAATTNSLSGTALREERKAPLREALGSAALREVSPDGSRASETAPPDLVRSQLILFANAIEDGDLDMGGVLFDELSGGRPQELALDINVTERVARKLGLYGYECARQGRRDEAIAVFEHMAAQYPDSMLGNEWAEAAAFLRTLPTN